MVGRMLGTIKQSDGSASVQIVFPWFLDRNHERHVDSEKSSDEWFSELDIIHSELLIQYKHDITENETFNHIIYKLKPMKLLWQLLYDPNYVPNLHSLKRDIRQIYTNSKSANVTTNKSRERILAAIRPKSKPNFKMQFKGECHLCGAQGHRAADCWDNERNKDKGSSKYKMKTPDTPTSSHNTQKQKLKCDY
jgi:hypothetical protein